MSTATKAPAGTEAHSPQEAQFEALTTEIVGKIDQKLGAFNAKFSDLEKKLTDGLTGHAKDIAKLSDAVDESQAALRKRFLAWADHHETGGRYKGAFGSRENAARFGALLQYVASAKKPEYAALHEQAGEALKKFAIAPTTGAGGAFLWPDTFIDALIYNVEQYGVCERLIPFQEVDSDGVMQPKYTGAASVFYPDYGGTPTESTLSFQRISDVLTRYAVLTFVDGFMLKSRYAGALADFVAKEMGRALAKAMDTNWLMGDGTSTYARVVGAFKSANVPAGQVITADTGDDTFAEVISASVKYLSKVQGAAPEWVDNFDPRWIMHRSIFFAYMGVRDSQNRPITDILLSSGAPQRVLLGDPVEVSQVCPALSATAVSTVMAVWGPWSEAWTGFRLSGGVMLRQSNEIKFHQNQIALQLDVMQALVEKDANPICHLKTAAS